MQLASILIFGVALAVAPLAIGGVHTPVAVAVCGLAAIAMLLQFIDLRTRSSDRGLYVSIPMFGLLLLFGASVLQVVPLPEFVQRVLSPEGHDLVTGGLRAAGLGEVSWRSLSVDPGATSDRAVRFAALFLMGLVASNLRSRQAWVLVGRIILIVAMLVLLAGAALYVTGAHDLWFYESLVGFRAPSTFVNLNHGAAFFGLAALAAIALGLGAERRRPIEGAGFWAAALLFSVVGALHDSDGVAVAFGGTLLVGAFALWIRAGRPTRVGRETRIASVVLVVLATALAVWLDLFDVARRFFERLFLEGEHGNRLELVRAGAAMVADFWPVGAGAGAVETLIPGYMNWQSTSTGATIPVLENDTLEVLFGFGIFVGSLALVAIASVLYFAGRNAFTPSRTLRFALALVSALYLFFLAQLHFPLFALGVGVPGVVWIEALMSSRVLDSREHEALATGHVVLPLRWGIALVALVVVAATATTVAHYTTYRYELGETIDEEAAERAIRLRPSDHRIYVRLATQAAKAGRAADAKRLAEFARSRNALPRIRLFLARAKANAEDREGALAEYDALLEEDHGDILLIRGVLADFGDAKTRVQVFGDHPSTWSSVAAASLRLEGGPAAADFALALVEAKPKDARAYKVATETYLHMQQPFLAQLWAELLIRRDVGTDEDIDGLVLLARALLAAGNREQARDLLNRAITENSDSAHPELHRLALGLKSDVATAPQQEAEHVRTHYKLLCPSPIPANQLRLCWETEAWLAEHSGNLKRAEMLLERVHRKFNEPMPLVHMLTRHLMCHEIDRVAADARPAQRARIDDMVSRCQDAARKME